MIPDAAPVLAPALLAGAAVALALGRPGRSRRLDAVLPSGGGARPAASAAARAGPSGGPGRERLPPARAACLLAGGALALLLGGGPGLVAGAALAVLGPRALARLEPAALRRAREQRRAELPLALDLLGACLSGGAAPGAAAQAVGRALPGPCGDRFAAAGRALEVGVAPGAAWAVLAADDEDELAAAAVRALVRAAEGGAPVVATVALLGQEAARAAEGRGREAAERVGVLAVAPLGLCFLPAFVLLGVVPVVAGLVAPLLAGG